VELRQRQEQFPEAPARHPHPPSRLRKARRQRAVELRQRQEQFPEAQARHPHPPSRLRKARRRRAVELRQRQEQFPEAQARRPPARLARARLRMPPAEPASTSWRRFAAVTERTEETISLDGD
jgi:hypothetical protein